MARMGEEIQCVICLFMLYLVRSMMSGWPAMDDLT